LIVPEDLSALYLARAVFTGFFRFGRKDFLDESE